MCMGKWCGKYCRFCYTGYKPVPPANLKPMGLRVVWCLLVLSFGVSAQVSTPRLTGSVQDPSGALVAGATVTLRHEATGVVRTTTTTDAGTYTFDAIPTGSYTVEV